MKDEQVSMVLAVTPPKQLVGYITADDALRCAKEGQTNLMNCVQQDILTVPHDLLLEEVLPIISDSKTPVAVMKNNQLVGVLIRGVVIEALAKETSAEVTAHE